MSVQKFLFKASKYVELETKKKHAVHVLVSHAVLAVLENDLQCDKQDRVQVVVAGDVKIFFTHVESGHRW